MNNRNKNEMASALITLLLMAVVLCVLVFSHLHYQYPPENGKELQADLQQDSIMFGGEYVMLGNTPEPNPSEDMDNEQPEQAEEVAEKPSTEGEDLEDAGQPAKQPKPLVQSKQESPMKVKEKKVEKKQKTGPSEEQIAQKEKEKRNKNAVNSKIANAFGKSGGSGKGKQGSPDGNSSSGSLTGKPGIGGLVGYTLEYWGRPHSQWTGTVVVKVRVNTRGRIIEAHCVGGTGGAYAHPSVRRYCEQETLKSAFSVPKNTTTEGVGTVTWRFVD